jgi:hypothetical protein
MDISLKRKNLDNAMPARSVKDTSDSLGAALIALSPFTNFMSGLESLALSDIGFARADLSEAKTRDEKSCIGLLVGTTTV